MIIDLAAGVIGLMWMFMSLLIMGAQHGQSRSEATPMAIIGAIFGFLLSMLGCELLRIDAHWVAPWCIIVGVVGTSTLIYGLANTAILICQCFKPLANTAWSIGSIKKANQG